MKAGPMDVFLTIQSAETTRDSAGGVVLAWSDLQDAWVSRKQQSGNEAVQAQRETVVETVEFWGHLIDWASVTTANRIVIDSSIYNIRRIDLIRHKGAALIVADFEGLAEAVSAALTWGDGTAITWGDGTPVEPSA